MMEDWFTAGTFDDHPHRGIETVTMVLDGELEHRDNRGGHGTLGPGDVQWMTAGRGVLHSEQPMGTGRVHTLQLWVNLPSYLKMTAPRYQDLRKDGMPVRSAPGATLRVFSGSSGDAVASTLNHVPITMVEIVLEPGAAVSQALPPRVNGFIYLLEGAGHFGPDRTPARAGQVVWLARPAGEGPSELRVEGAEALRAVLWAGPPLAEPVVAAGPFVMNTTEEIARAYADLRAGRF